MTPIPIGALAGSVRGTKAATPASDQVDDDAGFGMALGLAISAHPTPAASIPNPVLPGTNPGVALADAGATVDGAILLAPDPSTNAASVSAPSATGASAAGAAATLGSQLARLTQALQEAEILVRDTEHGANAGDANLGAADGSPEAPLDPAAVASEMSVHTRRPVPTPSHSVPIDTPVTSTIANADGEKLARALRSLASAGATAPTSTAGAASAARAAGHDTPSNLATDRTGTHGTHLAAASGSVAIAGAGGAARAKSGGPGGRGARSESAASEAADTTRPIAEPATSAPLSAGNAGRVAAGALAETGVTPAAVPRDLAAALDAAIVAPRRALDQVSLPFEGENGLEGRLRIALRGNTLHATIVAPDRDTAARIESAMGELRRALVERGFADVKLAVQAPGASAEFDRARSGAREQERDAPSRGRDEERATGSHQHSRGKRRGRGQEE